MVTPSTHAGMGAIPFSGGVSFRVWAPFASAVFVVGDFNGGSETATPLASEGNGNWSADVSAASPGHEYKFIVDGLHRVDPRARDVTNSVGSGVIVDDGYNWKINDFRVPPWNELVIYEMHAATFPDDPVSHGKLLDAIAGDMPYLQDLGINAIELMPTNEFPGDDSWGYNPSHVFAIEDAYGGPDALKQLVDAAHQHGIAVILDVVYNHFGPNDLPTWQFDGWFQHWNDDAMGGIYFYNDWRAHTDWGAKNRPDYGRPEVRSFIRDNVMMWLQDYRIDGLRFDMTPYIRNVYGREDPSNNPNNLAGAGWNLLRWINDEINHFQPWKISIAEDFRQNQVITASTSAGGAGFDGQWDDQFHHPVLEVLTTARDEDRDMNHIRHAIERRYNGDAFRRVVYTESHDEVSANGIGRVPDAIDRGNADGWHAKKRSTLGAALVFTTPAIPLMFQGQEILEWIRFGDRNRVDWEKFDQFRGIYHLYRDLIRLRRNWHNNTRGLRGQHANVFHVNHTDKVIAFHRWQRGGGGDDVIVVLNFGNRGYADYSIGFPRPGQWFVRLNSDWNGYDPDFSNWHAYDTAAHSGGQDDLSFHGNVGLGPYTALILSQ